MSEKKMALETIAPLEADLATLEAERVTAVKNRSAAEIRLTDEHVRIQMLEAWDRHIASIDEVIGRIKQGCDKLREYAETLPD